MKIHQLLILNFLDEYELLNKLFSTTFLELTSHMLCRHLAPVSATQPRLTVYIKHLSLTWLI